MNIKVFTSLLVLLVSMSSFGSKAYSDELGIGEVNVCIAQFPCHLKTGKLLPGFGKGTACNWEGICSKYRSSPSFIKLKKKLQKQTRASKRKVNPVHRRR